MSFQNIRPKENAEVQKNNNVQLENYFNNYFSINVSQLPENDDEDEEVSSVKFKEVVNDINELTNNISDLLLTTDVLVESKNCDVVSNELVENHETDFSNPTLSKGILPKVA